MTSPKIEVLGSGCQSCKRLHEAVVRTVKQLGSEAEVGYVTDVNRLLELGVMQSPVLAIDGKPVAVGFIPNDEQLASLIGGAIGGGAQGGDNGAAGGGCRCGGRC